MHPTIKKESWSLMFIIVLPTLFFDRFYTRTYMYLPSKHNPSLFSLLKTNNLFEVEKDKFEEILKIVSKNSNLFNIIFGQTNKN